MTLHFGMKIAKNIREFLNEVIDTPVKWRWAQLPAKDGEAKAVFDVGLYTYAVRFTPISSEESDSVGLVDLSYHVDAVRGEDGVTTADQYANTMATSGKFKRMRGRSKARLFSHDLTGTGHAGQVLATVAAVAGDYIRRAKPEGLTYTTDTPKRADVYKAMLNRAKKFAPKNMRAKLENADTYEDLTAEWVLSLKYRAQS